MLQVECWTWLTRSINTLIAAYKFISFVRGCQKIRRLLKTLILNPATQASRPDAFDKTKQKCKNVSPRRLNYAGEERGTGGLAVTLNNMFYDERLDLGQVSLLAQWRSSLFKGQFGELWLCIHTFWF